MTIYDSLKEKYANIQDDIYLISNEVRYEESKIYEELTNFIENKYPELLPYLEDFEFYDSELMRIFLTSGNEKNFIERVIKGYGVNIDNIIKGLSKEDILEILQIKEDLIINKYLNKKYGTT